MYDHLRCERPLPPPCGGEAAANAEIVYQTKDLSDPAMGHYALTRDGRLTIDRSVPPEEWSPADPEETEKRLKVFHGTLVFGRSEEDRKAGLRRSVEYRARFAEGVCSDIALHRFDESPLSQAQPETDAPPSPSSPATERGFRYQAVREAERSVTAELARLRMCLALRDAENSEPHAEELAELALALRDRAKELHERASSLRRSVSAFARTQPKAAPADPQKE